MKDRIVEHPGRYRLSKVSGTDDVFDLIPAPGDVTEEGTFINKTTLLDDDTAEMLWNPDEMPEDPTPNLAFQQIGSKSVKILDAAPTESTEGSVGQFALYGEDLYICVSATDGVYVWNPLQKITKTLLTEIITEDTVWTMPSNLLNHEVSVRLFGGGGGGGCDAHNGGGCGGYMATGVFQIAPGVAVPVTIGVGGEGGYYNKITKTGRNGGVTSFGTYLSANGGAGRSSSTQEGGSGGGGGYSSDAAMNGGNGTYGGGGGGGGKTYNAGAVGSGGSGGTYGGGGGGGGNSYDGSTLAKPGAAGNGGEYGGDGGVGGTTSTSPTAASAGIDTSAMTDLEFTGSGAAGNSPQTITGAGGGGGGGYGGSGGSGGTSGGGGGGGGGYGAAGGKGGSGTSLSAAGGGGGGGGGYGGAGGAGCTRGGGGGGGGYGVSGKGGNGGSTEGTATNGGIAAGGGGLNANALAGSGGPGICILTYTVVSVG